MKNVLVTGASGFIGSHLCKKLNSIGYAVYKTTANIGNDSPGTVVCDDFRKIDFDKLPSFDALFHQAAITDTLEKNTSLIANVNYYAAMDLFRKAVSKCSRIIYASSCAVYGNVQPPFQEDGRVSPLNAYGWSKLLLDGASKSIKEIPVFGLRYSNVYGFGEGHKKKTGSMVGQIIDKVLKRENPCLFEWGEQKRDFVYIGDVIDANILCLESTSSGVFNVGSGTAVSFNRLVDTVNKQANSLYNLPIIETCYVPNPIATVFQNWTECDITKSSNVLGYRPRWSLEDGVERYFLALANNRRL